jgi:uracil-DNA glycosylase
MPFKPLAQARFLRLKLPVGWNGGAMPGSISISSTNRCTGWSSRRRKRFRRCLAAPRREESGGQAPAARIGGPRDAWPASLGAFAEWWMAEPTLDGGTVRDRAAPRGPQGAELMVLVPAPGQDDGEQLLTGRDGSVLAAMLRAMGLEPDTVYFASALPRHIPLPDWDSLARDGLGEVLAHHIGLVAPQRLIAFGPSILPLLGHDPAQIAKTSLRFNHEGSNVKLFGALDLGTLATKPARKAGFWQRWLEFSA